MRISATSPPPPTSFYIHPSITKHIQHSPIYYHSRIMSRTGVANLLCNFCFRRFKQPIWLQNHIEKKHPEVWSQRRESKKRAADKSEQDEDHQAKYMCSSSRTFLPNSSSPSYEADVDEGTQPANKAANNPVYKPEASATVRVYPDAGLPCAYIRRPMNALAPTAIRTTHLPVKKSSTSQRWS
jgi:hypothetical protein